MKVAGFTFVRNGALYDYPIVEAILSILPLCDELIVAVGQSEDDTLALIKSIENPKIKIIETIWDESLRQGGRVLAVETDKAFAAISPDVDWAFYIQGDEVLHEKYLPIVRQAMQDNLTDKTIDGLLFDYKHFYGSYDYVGDASNWYRHEIRVIRNDPNFFSYRDAQGFRKNKNATEGEKLCVKKIDACIYHYGWVKDPSAMQRKQKTFQKLWHSDAEAEARTGDAAVYVYEKNMQRLSKFTETHPQVMRERIRRLNWDFNYQAQHHHVSFKERVKQFCKKYLGLDFSYKNYTLK